MDNDNYNEFTRDELIKSQNNFQLTKITNINTKDQNFVTSKTFNRLPPLAKTRSANDIRQGYNYTLRSTTIEFNSILDNQQPEYDPFMLKKELSYYRKNLQKKNTELILLKIKFNKLLGDNTNNKALIANALSIPPNSYITKDVLIYKIEHCELTEEHRKILKKAYEIIKIKLEIAEQKKKNCSI